MSSAVVGSAFVAAVTAAGEASDTISPDMNTVRYLLALFLVITLPALFFYWLLIHPFVTFWRGKGIGPTYMMVLSAIIAGMIALFALRHFLLGVDYGTSYGLCALGLVLLLLSASLRFAIHQHLDIKTLLGLPEIAPDRFPRRLVTEGIYGRMRHPRYAQLLMALVGYALIANYLAGYLAVALWVGGIYLIVVLEEKELRAYFGGLYDEYCRRVPRFVPRLGSDS